MPKKIFSIVNMGCFRNAYDAKIIASEFLEKNYRASESAEKADTVIVNTCGFIDKAKEESIQAIRDALILKRKGLVKRVIVAGCLSQRYPKILKKHFIHVDEWRGVLGNQRYSRSHSGIRHSEFLKICEGCVNRCSYCAIPSIKGPLYSRSSQAIIQEAQYLESQGVKELVIIGQDISSWGMDTNEGRLAFLLDKIIKKTRIPWIRLLYLHPRHVEDELLELIAGSARVCKYIDLPIQHIHDRILKLMNRRTTGKEIRSLIDKIRRKIPNVALRTSVIVGFPGETEKEFLSLLHFLRQTKFERLGAFAYSREEKTAAFGFKPQVHASTKRRRLASLLLTQQEIAKALNSRFIAKTLNVLIEAQDKDLFVGRSEFDAPEVDGTVFVKRPGLKIGEFYRTQIVDAYEHDLVGI